jgi:hypothetical protein
MAIRFKKYRHKAGGTRVFRAIRVTEKNIPELVAYICRNGGAATGHTGDTKSGRPPRIRIKQRTFGNGWTKRDWRVAKVGDFIVRYDHEDEIVNKGLNKIEYERVTEDNFEVAAELI